MKKLFLLTLVLGAAAAAAAQTSGGTFNITNSVTGSGGGTLSGGLFNVIGTAGQPSSGSVSSGAPYTVRSGFWQPIFAPTAATVSVGGRVLSPDGTGLKNVIITLTGGTLTRPLIARSSPFGYFSFEEIEIGQGYVMTVLSKRYGFAQDSQFITPFDHISDIVFQANWENSN